MRIIKPSKRPRSGPLNSQADFSPEVKEIPSSDSHSRDQEKHRAVTAPAAESEYQTLFSKGIHLLAMREHSVRELTEKLSKKSDCSDQVYAVIDDLLEQNYLSDDRFTESFVRSRMNRGMGPLKIKSELSSKGVDECLIDEYVDFGQADWFENATMVYRKKYGEGPINDYNTWTKRARFMQSRGFTMEHIQITLPKVDFE